MSLEEDEEEEDAGKNEEEELGEEDTNIRSALNWKRRHFFINCFFISMFLMLKLEFSYGQIFG